MDNNHASIIVPNTDYRGVIVSDNPKYQFINWTGYYRIALTADTGDAEISETHYGDYETVKAIYNANRKLPWVTAIVRELRILGDGTPDWTVTDYHIMTECAPRGFVFPEVTA